MYTLASTARAFVNWQGETAVDSQGVHISLGHCWKNVHGCRCHTQAHAPSGRSPAMYGVHTREQHTRTHTYTHIHTHAHTHTCTHACKPTSQHAPPDQAWHTSIVASESCVAALWYMPPHRSTEGTTCTAILTHSVYSSCVCCAQCLLIMHMPSHIHLHAGHVMFTRYLMRLLT